MTTAVTDLSTQKKVPDLQVWYGNDDNDDDDGGKSGMKKVDDQ